MKRRRPSSGWSLGRLVAILVVLSVGPLALLAFSTVRLSTDAVSRQVEARVAATAAASSVAVQEEMTGLSSVVASYARRPSLIDALANADRRRSAVLTFHLRELQEARPGIAAAFVADLHGRLIDIVPSTPSIIGKDFSYRDWFRGVQGSRGQYVSEAYESQAAGHPRVVAAATVVRDRRGRRLAILVAAYRVDAIQSFVDRFASSQGTRLVVTDQRGVVVAAPGASRGPLVSRRSDPLVAHALRGDAGITTRHTPAGDMLSAYTPVRELGWTIVAAVPRRAALAPIDRLRSAVLLVTGVLMLTIGAGIVLLALALQGRKRANERAERSSVDAMRAKAEAERANNAKSEFLSRMSHELRTPLNAVLGFGQLLALEPLDANQQESVDQILKAGDHLLALINEVLDISRIEAGRLSLSLEPVCLAETVFEAIDLVRPLAAERGIALSVSPMSDDCYVVADRQRLKQVLLNLLANAVKYNREGGSALIAARRHGRTVRLEVADTGSGIPEDRLERVFAPFDRLDAEQSTIEGTGLGLALSKGLVEAMNGELGVVSKLGAGSTFWVELAAAESELRRVARTAELPPTDDALALEPASTVLYIEDNLSNLKLVERVLAQRPHIRLVSAMQGGLGLELAREHRPDLVLLDLHLPDIQGDEVLSRLRADPTTAQIPVVVLSADATPGRISRLLDAGAAEYLSKPLDVKRFLEVLDEQLRATAPLPLLTR